MEQVMDNNFIRQVYYHSLKPFHKSVEYTPIDFTFENGNGNGYERGSEYGDGSGYGYGNGYGSGSG